MSHLSSISADIVDDLDMIINFVAKMLVVMLVGCGLTVVWALLFPHRRTVGETDKKPPDKVCVALSRDQCDAMRSLAYEASKRTDDAEQQDFLDDLAGQIERAQGVD